MILMIFLGEGGGRTELKKCRITINEIFMVEVCGLVHVSFGLHMGTLEGLLHIM